MLSDVLEAGVMLLLKFLRRHRHVLARVFGLGPPPPGQVFPVEERSKSRRRSPDRAGHTANQPQGQAAQTQDLPCRAKPPKSEKPPCSPARPKQFPQPTRKTGV